MKKQRVYLFLFLLVPLLLVLFTGLGAAASGDKPEAESSGADGVVELLATGFVPSSSGRSLAYGPAIMYEVEPNGTAATANPITGSSAVIEANIYPNADEDYFSFTAAAGDRVYAATMTSFSGNASTDSRLWVLDTDGTTILEFDDDDGTFGGLSSSIAGVTIPAGGTYYLRVSHFSATGQLRPYRLYFQLRSGSPTAETEPNNLANGGQPIPASGWVSGVINPAADNDVFTIALNAGDTVFISLDMDPERDGGTTWNGRVGLGAFGAPASILLANDASTTSPNSEAFFMTVQNAGTYLVYVDQAASGGNPAWTYHLSVSVFPHTPATANCTTYTSTDVPVTIPTGPGLVSSTLTVPGNPRIADIDVTIHITHTAMADLDVHLVSPAGNDNGLFTDVGAAAQQGMNLILDDEAGIPIGLFTINSGMRYAPEQAYRLDWFDGIDAGGVWRLDIRDDLAANGGTLNSWSITICEPEPLPSSCGPNQLPVTVFSTDLEANDGGFTSSGTENEWQWGAPTFYPINSCNSGSNCWVTDLTGTYNANSNQNLLTPNINLTGLTGPVILSWAQKYQIQDAGSDRAYVDVQLAGGGSPTRLWEWLGPTMTNSVGNPATTIQSSAGWSVWERDISSYAGQNIEMLFHLDSNATVHLAGLAIDDVSVTACMPVNPAVNVTKTVGTDASICAATNNITVPAGTEVTYCYTVQNSGDITLTHHTVEDSELGTLIANFPSTLAPSATTFFTASAIINSSVTNVVTWTAFITNTLVTTFDTDSATVTVMAGMPEIAVNKTVGTDPTTCATTSTISVPYGSTVYYCYAVENTGNITLTHHTVEDDVMGTLANGLPFDLGPAATYWFTAAYTLTSESVTNIVTWTAYIDGTAIQAVGTDSATVNGQPTDVSLSSVGGSDGAMQTVMMILAAAAFIMFTLLGSRRLFVRR
ncbi:MAG: proprotein convertase P-domain-containing protein [Anaerolineae bacterium]|nr:proprotein convertase P-domain-containing protein [Anaerolineae bacterium]